MHIYVHFFRFFVNYCCELERLLQILLLNFNFDHYLYILHIVLCAFDCFSLLFVSRLETHMLHFAESGVLNLLESFSGVVCFKFQLSFYYQCLYAL